MSLLFEYFLFLLEVLARVVDRLRERGQSESRDGAPTRRAICFASHFQPSRRNLFPTAVGRSRSRGQLDSAQGGVLVQSLVATDVSPFAGPCFLLC